MVPLRSVYHACVGRNVSASESMRIFVTGASGLVGSHLLAQLLAQGKDVVGTIRHPDKKRPLMAQLSQWQSALTLLDLDLSEINALARGMKNCDAVVHTAAIIDPNGNRSNLMRVNVDGTDNVLQAAIQAKVKHFIHISSLAVITGEKDKFRVTENEPLQYCREPYANSKIDAEKIVMNEAGRGQIAVTVLRPGFIYGPNERAWMPRLIEALRKGRAPVVGNGQKETNVIYVGNLCRAISLALMNPRAYGQIYNLTDGQLVTKRELFDTICDGLQIPRAKVSIPVSLARLLCELSSFAAPFAPPGVHPLLARYSRPAYRLAVVNQGFDISKAERELGYIDRTSFAEAMAKTLADWQRSPTNS